MHVKEIYDDYLSEERDKNGYRKIKDNAPEKAKKAYSEYMRYINDCIKNNEPIAK